MREELLHEEGNADGRTATIHVSPLYSSAVSRYYPPVSSTQTPATPSAGSAAHPRSKISPTKLSTSFTSPTRPLNLRTSPTTPSPRFYSKTEASGSSKLKPVVIDLTEDSDLESTVIDLTASHDSDSDCDLLITRVVPFLVVIWSKVRGIHLSFQSSWAYQFVRTALSMPSCCSKRRQTGASLGQHLTPTSTTVESTSQRMRLRSSTLHVRRSLLRVVKHCGRQYNMVRSTALSGNQVRPFSFAIAACGN